MAAVSGKRKRNKINKNNAGYFFIAPYFIVFLTFTLYPILYTFKLSFMSWDGFGEQQFIGLANYQRLLQDQMFIKSIGNTIFIALLAMIPQMVFGLVLAFLLNQKKLRGSNFFKTVFYFPNLVTAVSLASFMARGVVRMASSATVMMVGNAMIAKTTLPAKAVSPTGRSKVFWIRGTITTNPKKP